MNYTMKDVLRKKEKELRIFFFFWANERTKDKTHKSERYRVSYFFFYLFFSSKIEVVKEVTDVRCILFDLSNRGNRVITTQKE